MRDVLGQQIEENLLSMIIPEFHFFEIEGEFFWQDAMKLDQALFGKGPEAFQSVDVDFSARVSFFMVDSQVAITAEHKRIVAAIFIGIDDRSATDRFDRHIQQRGRRDVFDDVDLHHPVSLQNAENRDFMGRSPAPLTFPLSSEVRFVHFDLAAQKIVGFEIVGHDRLSNHGDRFEGRGVTEADLLGYLAGRYFKFEELEDSEPGLGRDFDFIKPATREVVESKSAALTPELFITDSIDFMAPTSTAENMAVFPAEFAQITPRPIFCVNNEFKSFKVQRHHYILVSNLL